MKTKQRMIHMALSVLVIASFVLTMTSQARADAPLPVSNSAASLLLDTPVDNVQIKISRDLINLTGPREVAIRLTHQPAGLMPDNATQKAQAAAVMAQQNALVATIRALDPSAVLLGRTRMVLNAVMMSVDSAKLNQIAADARVVKINPVAQYQLDLSETVPYIGATPAVQSAAASGAGVKVAVLDSGIDYTHVAFGGAGTLAAYLAAYGATTSDPKNTTPDGLFPTARVVGGYDFVGDAWPNGPLAPDADPIDCSPSAIGCAGGHGTHVADIIGGAMGVAPKVDLYAVKVCSAVSTSCSGIAMLEGIDFAVDPNGDGSTSDHVDIINMSLGSTYGQNYDDDSSIAVDNATAAGVLTVASAGNSADKPYVVGTPSAARTALSVAQTEVPSAKLQVVQIVSPASIAGVVGGVFQPWAAPLTALIEAPVQFGNGAGGNTLGCSAFPAGSLAGKIVLLDRGTCSVSIKAANVSAAGGLASIVGLVAPGDPFAFGYGGGVVTTPSYNIRQSDAARIKSQLAGGVTIRLDPANQPSLAGTVVGSSSRGPTVGQMFYGNTIQYGQIIKPEIAAPGASVSAVAGSGNGVEAFGGTSGASPMVAGAAALIKNVNPFLSPQEIKTWLMNTAETNVMNAPQLFGGGLAPITRIGGGEVRVNRAAAVKAAAWEQTSRGGALSYGFLDVSATTALKRTVVVKNYTNKSVTYNIASAFRFADDQATGAVSLSLPASITVSANGSKTFVATLNIDPTKLRNWTLNLGPGGGNADTLTLLEYDGYITLSTSAAGYNPITLPWQVLPRKAANVGGPTSVRLNTPANLTNSGKATAQVDSYALIATNPFNQASGFAGAGQPVTIIKNVGVQTYSGVGICPGNSYLLSFAINAYKRNTTPEAPFIALIDIDVNRDGVADFEVFNSDFSLSGVSDGRNLAWVANLRTGTANAFFYTDHSSNTANTVLTICGSQLSDLSRPASLGGPFATPALGQLLNVEVGSYDNYFTGNIVDTLSGIVFAPGGEKYSASVSDIPAGGSSVLKVVSTGSTLATTETGVLLMLNGSRASGKNGNPEGKEALAIKVLP